MQTLRSVDPSGALDRFCHGVSGPAAPIEKTRWRKAERTPADISSKDGLRV
jgi:hypothetical protein